MGNNQGEISWHTHQLAFASTPVDVARLTFESFPDDFVTSKKLRQNGIWKMARSFALGSPSGTMGCRIAFPLGVQCLNRRRS